MPDPHPRPTPESQPPPAEDGLDARASAWASEQADEQAGEQMDESVAADDALTRALAPDETCQPPADLLDRILAATVPVAATADTTCRAAVSESDALLTAALVTDADLTDDVWSARLDVALAADAPECQPPADLVDRIVERTLEQTTERSANRSANRSADPVIARLGPRLWAPLAALAAGLALAVGAWFFSQSPAGQPTGSQPQVAVQPPEPAGSVAPAGPANPVDVIDPVLALERELALYQPPDASFDRDVTLLHAELTDLRTWPQATWTENADDDPWSDLTIGSASELF